MSIRVDRRSSAAESVRKAARLVILPQVLHTD
jgi:hypothetical protein